MSEQFPQHMTILAFDQRIVVAMPGSRFGKFNAKFFQQFSHPIVHIFGTVVAVHVITSLNSSTIYHLSNLFKALSVLLISVSPKDRCVVPLANDH